MFHRGKMKVVNKMFQANNLLHCNQKSRSTFFQGREDDANVMMIVTYALTPCNFSFFENDVLQNKDNDKLHDIFIYNAYTFALLCNRYSGYEKLGVASSQEGEKDQHYICTIQVIIVNQISKVKAKINFHPSYFLMAKLLLGLYDYRSKRFGILEEIYVTTPTNLHFDHLNHEGVLECLEESSTNTFQEGEDDEDIPAMCNLDAMVTPDLSSITPNPPLVTPQASSEEPVMQEQTQVNEESVTHNRAKKLQQEVHVFLSELRYNIDESHILPKSCTLLLLRVTQEASPSGYVKVAEGYIEDTMADVQAKKGYTCKTQGYVTEASTSRQVCTISGRDRDQMIHH
jgi:hypothetical protein